MWDLMFMNKISQTRRILFLGATLFIQHQSSAQILLEPTAIPIQLSYHNESLDGMSHSAYHLTAEDVKLSWQASPSWKPTQSHGRGVSLEFQDRGAPELKLQFGLYQSNASIPDLTPESIANYLSQVEETFPQSEITILNKDSFVPVAGSAPFLSGYYRCIYFKVTDADPDTEDLFICDLLTILASKYLFVVREKGPEQPINYKYANIQSSVLKFMEL